MRIIWPLILLVSSALPVVAQKAQPVEHRFPLVQINVSGSQRYSNQAIVAYLGLRTGQQVSQKELEAASQKLADSGLFSLVQFRFGMAGNGVVANFDLADNTKLVPIEFENLVWFSPNELTTTIKQKLPLFSGVVPLSGSFNEQIREALQAVIQSKGIQGTVTSLPMGRLGDISSMLYKVEGNEIRVTDCEFAGAENGDRLELFELTKYLGKVKYEKSFVNAAIQSRLKDMYDAKGYLGARFGEPVVRVGSTAPDHTDVALTVAVAEGRPFTFAGIEWKGNTVYSADELLKVTKMKPGQVAAIPKFRQDLDSVKILYGRKGYLGVKMEFTPVLAVDNTAVFNVELREGKQYRLGKIDATGVPAGVLSKMAAEWQIKPGDIYDASYPQLYMATKFGKYIPQPLRWEWHNREVIHDDTQTVDLLIEVEIKPASSAGK